MLNIYVIKKTFVRQLSQDGCGPACLAMVLRYVGRPAEAEAVNRIKIQPGGLSLRNLQLLGTLKSLPCNCVELEMEFLKGLNKPVILHTVNDLGQTHFQVCYGYYKFVDGNKFLVADPAIQVRYISETDLKSIWRSRAALYFDDLEFAVTPDKRCSFSRLISLKLFPLGIILVIPFLSFFIASFGIALTWLLQKGLLNSSIFSGQTIYLLLALLFLISLFKNLFSFLRQYILIKINMSTNRTLINQLTDKFIALLKSNCTIAADEVDLGFVDVQKIQNGLSAFISVIISDGSLVVILLASSTYVLPVSGLSNLLYVLVVMFWGIITLPDFIYQSYRIKALSAASQTVMFDHIQQHSIEPGPVNAFGEFQTFYADNLKLSRAFAVKLSKRYFILECLGTINLIFTITYCAILFDHQHLDYQSLILIVIESYLVSALVQKIWSALPQVGEGADAAITHFKE
jgi:ABC-type bacteriocin/lantibiotic exporter with double-glycine peptidase domain